MLGKLGDSLKETLRKIASSVFVDEKLVNELVKDIQRALLQSDVNVKLVFELGKNIKDRALKEKTPSTLTKKEHLVNIVYEELTRFLGGDKKEFVVSKKPLKIMLVGLFGNGKTTTAAKLGRFFSNRQHKVALISTDTWRPAAFEQLRQMGKDMHVYGDPTMKDPVLVYKKYEAELLKHDVIIIDTAGRDALNTELVDEIAKINSAVSPDETFLVLSADVGQTAQKQAESFHEQCNVTGVIITKLDGTAKGGGALIACSVTDAPVRFIGTGEKINEFEVFSPTGFVGRLLGMGDLEALLEKAKIAISDDEAQDISKKMLKGDFNLIDLYNQMQAMKKMGPLSKLIEMIPGFGQVQIPKEAIEVQQEKLEKWKFIMDSCTKEELEDPELISGNRVERIANGSGMNTGEVKDLVKHYKQSKKVMKNFKSMGNMQDPKQMQKMMKKMKGFKGMKF
ncbi:signal recognition particle protein [Candidatus Woesearchaeota archaeon]|nr:signal recognition particle protein [Candidatus Woesearchaeota archaeon]